MFRDFVIWEGWGSGGPDTEEHVCNSCRGRTSGEVLGAMWAGADANELQLWMHLHSECLLRSCTLGFGLPHPSRSPAQNRPRNSTDVAERGTRGWGQSRTSGGSAPDLCLKQPREKKGRKDGEVRASFNWRTRGFILVQL